MFNLEIKTRFGQQWLQFVCEAPCKTSKECASQRHGLHFFTRQVKLSYIYIYIRQGSSEGPLGFVGLDRL